MPIQELTELEVVQVCGSCGKVTQHLLEDLGDVEEEAPRDPNVLRLPSCECGAIEFVIRSESGDGDHPIPGSFGHLHRLLVDSLHERLPGKLQKARRGRSVRLAAALAKAFPNGALKITSDTLELAGVSHSRE